MLTKLYHEVNLKNKHTHTHIYIHIRQSLTTRLTLLNKINIITYFKNLTIELHDLYALNICVKFFINHILFTI